MSEKLIPSLMRFIEKEQGITFHDENIDSFFRQLREEIKDSVQPDPSPESIALSYAEVAVKEREALDGMDVLEKSFRQWDINHNPVTMMVDNLINRDCSPRTVTTYRTVALCFMRMFGYEPEFTIGEYNQFMRQYQDSASASKRVYRQVCKLLWEAQGRLFPVKKQRIHSKHSIMPTRPPEFTPSQIAQIIKKVKANGTEEEKYLFCLATVWAPRRIEMCEITEENFTWNGKTGTLTFVPHKQQGDRPNVREHHIPEELVPYLKSYSYKTRERLGTRLNERFWRAVERLDLPVPRQSRSQRERQYTELRERHQRKRGLGWHAFRHALTSALVESVKSDTMVSKWMGWQSGSAAAPMVGTYYTPQELDAKILAKHPFIRYWAEK